MPQFNAANVDDVQKMELFIDTVGFESAKVIMQSDSVTKELGIDDPMFPDQQDDLPHFYEALTPEQGQELVKLLDTRMQMIEEVM